MNLLDRLKDPLMMQDMSLGEKLFASLQVTALGISIVFLALVLLYGIISLMTYIIKGSEKKPVAKKPEVAAAPPVVVEEVVEEETVDEGELIAVISAAIAASLNTSTNNIVVRNIVRVGDETPAWARVGRINQVR